MPIERAFAHIVIRAMTGQGFSQRAVMREVRRLGYGYRTKTMGDDIRRFSSIAKNEYYVKKLATDEVIPRGLMVEGELKRPFSYRVYGDVTYYNPETDSYDFREGSFYTDRQLNRDEAEDEFVDVCNRLYEEPEWEVAGFSRKAVEHNIGYAY